VEAGTHFERVVGEEVVEVFVELEGFEVVPHLACRHAHHFGLGFVACLQECAKQSPWVGAVLFALGTTVGTGGAWFRWLHTFAGHAVFGVEVIELAMTVRVDLAKDAPGEISQTRWPMGTRPFFRLMFIRHDDLRVQRCP
jgi:hypothetical protein